MNGNEILARSLQQQGVTDLFYLTAGPMVDAANECARLGVRMVDVRHEQAAAMMANAYARLRARPSVCMGGAGPGTTNLITGIAHAFTDCAPVVALGGSSPVSEYGLQAFQEVDQVALMRPVTRWAERVYDTARIPELVDMAFAHAFGSTPGPVYLDVPSNVVYREVAAEEVRWPRPRPRLRPHGDPAAVEQVIRLLAQAERPLILTGGGVVWSEAVGDLRRLVDAFGIPVLTTPQGRGVIPEDHPLSFIAARSRALAEADVVLLVGTRLNYVISHGRPPRFNPEGRLIQVDLDAAEIARTRDVEVGIVGDARAVILQLLEADQGRIDPARWSAWTGGLAEAHRARSRATEAQMASDARPIHPLRLCREIRDFVDRDAVVVVDGQDTLTFARQSIPYYAPRSLNSGPFGTMGVGLPFAIGAKVALPEAQVLVLHGDGSFGFNAVELDSAVRQGIDVLCVVCNNGGWTSKKPGKIKVGRDLRFSAYERLAEAFDAYGERVEEPDEIRPALERAAASGRPAVVNVIVDEYAHGRSVRFTDYGTYD
jgi:acetolactate synthase-1/2/3 large subunit